jgi:hypothetical protein
LDGRLDEPLPHEISREEARRLELRRHARDNRAAVNLIGGLRIGG